MDYSSRALSEIEKTKEEWRDLGFYYDVDFDACSWEVRASKNGIIRFADIIESYALDPKNKTLGEHVHLLPYRYLSISTWPERLLTKDGVAGLPDDLIYFAGLLRSGIEMCQVGGSFEIGCEYALNLDYKFIFYRENDNYDPSSSDSFKWAEDWA